MPFELDGDLNRTNVVRSEIEAHIERIDDGKRLCGVCSGQTVSDPSARQRTGHLVFGEKRGVQLHTFRIPPIEQLADSFCVRLPKDQRQ